MSKKIKDLSIYGGTSLGWLEDAEEVEKEELLLKDLCARLPYGVKIMVEGWDSDADCEFTTVETLIGIDDRFIHTIWDKTGDKDKHSIVEPLSILEYKPYLRPMSSMTEEERECYNNHLSGIITGIDAANFMIWIYSNHFDIFHLIEKGLALEAPEDMYNTKEK